MSSAFLGLNIALSGLFANQRSLQTVSHNISNANTKGYSRQRVEQSQFRPDVIPGLGAVGVGVKVDEVQQVRDKFLDFKYREENSMLSEWKLRTDALKEIEGIFNEPSKASIAQSMDNFYSAMKDFTKNPENLTVRTIVRQSGIALTETINRLSGKLKTMQKDLNFQFEQDVKRINHLAKEIVSLNRMIYESELGNEGRNNDVRDQRNLLVDELSNYADVDYFEDEKERFHVTISGHLLVAHYRSDNLALIERDKKLHDEDVDGIKDVRWSDGNKLITTSGSLKGVREVRDNEFGDLKGIPYYINKLNEFADTFAQEINKIHNSGFGLDGSHNINFFTVDGKSTANYREALPTPATAINGTELTPVDLNTLTDVTAIMEAGTAGLSGKAKMDKIKQNIEAYETANPTKRVDFADNKYYSIDKNTKLARRGNQYYQIPKHKDLQVMDGDVYAVFNHKELFKIDGNVYSIKKGNKIAKLQTDPADPTTLHYYEINRNERFRGVTDLGGNTTYYVVRKLSADRISVSHDIEDLNKIAASESADKLPGDNNIAIKLFRTRHDEQMFDWGAPEDYVKSLVSNLGVDTQKAKNVHTNQKMLVNNFKVQRESVSGVSLDEEMTLMIKFQHAYSANARMTNVFNDMLDLLVNRLGA